MQFLGSRYPGLLVREGIMLASERVRRIFHTKSLAVRRAILVYDNHQRRALRSLSFPMEQPCYKCGQAVEEGVAFCPHCAAPQIRVVMAEPAPAFAAASAQDSAALPASQTLPMIALPVQWSRSIKPCALAALAASILMVLGLMVPLIALVGAGFLAVALYRRNNPGVMMGAGAGARLGALCGFLCSLMTGVLGALRVVVLHEGNDVRKFFLDLVQQTAGRYPDPQLQSNFEWMRSPDGLIFMMVFIAIVAALAMVLLGSAGGALGSVILGRRDRS
jgi:uncharacterized membrane protein YphA (DoxX/SURF4 family)